MLSNRSNFLGLSDDFMGALADCELQNLNNFLWMRVSRFFAEFFLFKTCADGVIIRIREIQVLVKISHTAAKTSNNTTTVK